MGRNSGHTGINEGGGCLAGLGLGMEVNQVSEHNPHRSWPAGPVCSPVRSGPFCRMPIASALPPSLHLVSSSALLNQPTSRLCVFSSLHKFPLPAKYQSVHHLHQVQGKKMDRKRPCPQARLRIVHYKVVFCTFLSTKKSNFSRSSPSCVWVEGNSSSL